MLPSNIAQQQGQGAVSADNLNTLVQWCNTLSDLRAFVGLNGMQVMLAGYNTPGDGGQGLFRWNSSSTAPDNGTSVIVPTGAASGAWIRISLTGNISGNVVVLQNVTVQQTLTANVGSFGNVFTQGLIVGNISGNVALTGSSGNLLVSGNVVTPEAITPIVNMSGNLLTVGNVSGSPGLLLNGSPVGGGGGGGGGGAAGVVTSSVNATVFYTSPTRLNFNADEIIVETTLGGTAYKLSNVSCSLDTTTVGAGGMDSGSPPTNSDIEVYLIYNVSTGARALMACTFGSSASSTYTGAHMPSGYTASALVGRYVTQGTSFPPFDQYGNTVYLQGTVRVATSLSTTGTTQYASCANIIPKGAFAWAGQVITTYTGHGLSVCGPQGTAPSVFTCAVSGSLASWTGSFYALPLLGNQQFGYGTDTGTGNLTINATSYTLW